MRVGVIGMKKIPLMGQSVLQIDDDNMLTLPDKVIEALGTSKLTAIIYDDRIVIWRREDFDESRLERKEYMLL